HRHSKQPMETRELVAEVDPATGRLTIHASTQSAHLLKWSIVLLTGRLPLRQVLLQIGLQKDHTKAIFAGMAGYLGGGGMGAVEGNFYNALVCRYGCEAEAAEIQNFYLPGKKTQAEAAIPPSSSRKPPSWDQRATSATGSTPTGRRVSRGMKAPAPHVNHPGHRQPDEPMAGPGNRHEPRRSERTIPEPASGELHRGLAHDSPGCARPPNKRLGKGLSRPSRSTPRSTRNRSRTTEVPVTSTFTRGGERN